MKKLIYTLSMLLFVATASAQTVVDFIVNSPDHTILAGLVVDAELDDDLNTAGPFTVFAPTDAAFGNVPQETLDALTADPTGALAEVLLYHVVSGEALSASLADGDAIPTLLGPNVNVSINGMMVMINNATVTGADNTSPTNGVVHVINEVLIPPTVVDIAIASPIHTTLVDAVVQAGLVETLSGEGPFTVFAPTDEAFGNLDPDVATALFADPEGALADILLYHVVGAEALAGSLSDGDTFATALGPNINVTIDGDGNVFINDAQVIVTDILASNGVVHVIDAVITPPTVVDIAIASPIHTTLVDAVVQAGLVETLSGDGPFTVFAPTDEAFGMLDPDVVTALFADPEGDLANILLYHVVGAEALAGSLSDGDTFATALGPDINVTIDGDGNVFINDAQVIVTDILASNGVVHVIDAVLTPPTVVDIAIASPIHTTLVDAVVQAGLVETLSGEGPFTVFAPTDEAFGMLDPDVVNALFADPTGELADILTYHVVAGEALAGSLSNGDVFETVLGPNVIVTIDGDGNVFINDAEVIVTDIIASNGVVHVIDAVLLPPPSIVDIVVDSEIHTILEDAVIDAELVETLNGEGPFTVFAPTDEAFGMLDPDLVTELFADPTGDLADILTYHVVAGEAFSAGLMDGDVFETVLGPNIVITMDGDGNVFVNDAQVIVTDILASNGVVHVIDMVLTPPTVVDIAIASPIHTTLVDAVTQANLVETLSGDGPFTVFAPTDAAFGMLDPDLVTALFADPEGALADILTYHVIDGEVLSTSLNDGDAAGMLLGFDANVTIDGDNNIFIDGAQVIVADIIASNGVVHVIDMVMTPPTVVDVVVESPIHEILEDAVIAAELADDLSAAGPFTVFAPTDEAFGELDPDLVTELFANPTEDLADILLYHVVGAQALSTSLNDGDAFETLLAPAEIVISVSGMDVAVNTTSNVIQADILAYNGVVHVIDEVLTPPVSVEETELFEGTGIYPNPATDKLNVALNDAEDTYLTVMDAAGRILIEDQISGPYVLDVNELGTGAYFLRLTKGNLTEVKQFIVK